MANLHTKLENSEAALKTKTDAYNLLETKKKHVSAVGQGQLNDLNAKPVEMEREMNNALKRLADSETELKRLNDRNDYLQMSIRNAADAGLKAGYSATRSQTGLEEAQCHQNTAEEARE